MIESYRDINNAKGEVLDRLGEKYGQSRGQADDDFYRIMLKSKIASRRGDATVNGIIRTIQNAFNIEPKNIRVEPLENEPLAIRIVDIPIELAKTPWQQKYLLKRVEETSAAGIRVDQIRFVDTSWNTVKVVYGTRSAIISVNGPK
ncbi:hypothetical protein [Ligilactobacillus equi]|uniref:hypothetical protein n=1 Tax=Ligilactobacillus equi TaxID=137357 RepID=UPI001CDACC1D|nr:hypothetical protein [Ligilactobacillus equi]